MYYYNPCMVAGALYQLVTDQGFLKVDSVVWEALTSVHGDNEFVNSFFSKSKVSTDHSEFDIIDQNSTPQTNNQVHHLLFTHTNVTTRPIFLNESLTFTLSPLISPELFSVDSPTYKAYRSLIVNEFMETLNCLICVQKSVSIHIALVNYSRQLFKMKCLKMKMLSLLIFRRDILRKESFPLVYRLFLRDMPIKAASTR